jgi:hypothetical protein
MGLRGQPKRPWEVPAAGEDENEPAPLAPASTDSDKTNHAPF